MIWNRFLLIVTTVCVINTIQANMRDFKMSILNGKRHSCLNTSCSSIFNATVKNILQCQTNCLADERCLAVNYLKATKRCELFLNLPSAQFIADQYATAMIVASGARTPAVFWASGPQYELSPTVLSSGGWIECHTSDYATGLSSSILSTILSQCNRGKLFLACKPSSQAEYTLGAMGMRNDVLYDCGTTASCANVANGVAWYFSTSYSWGFAQAGDPVSRSSCDTSSINPTARLCWHTQGSGGYRCGSTFDLNYNTNWIRSIWHAD